MLLRLLQNTGFDWRNNGDATSGFYLKAIGRGGISANAAIPDDLEGPRIEKMLGYTNLDSEKGFAFFQRFLKEGGILDELENAGIQEGDTVRMYGFEFDYYK